MYYILLIIVLKVGIFIAVVVLGFFPVLTANKFKSNKKYDLLTSYFMHMTSTPIFKGINYAQLFSHGQANIPQIIQLLWWHKQALFLFKDGIIQRPLVLPHYFRGIKS